MTSLTTKARELLDGLDGVTPGPWGFEDDVNPELLTAGTDADGAHIYVGIAPFDAQTDLKHLSRCSPDNLRPILEAFLEQSARIETLEKALEPFARIADELEESRVGRSKKVIIGGTSSLFPTRNFYEARRAQSQEQKP